MSIYFIRALFFLLSLVFGFQLGSTTSFLGELSGIAGVLLGAVFAGGLILIERTSARVSLRGLSSAVFGLILAFVVSQFLNAAIDLIPELSLFAASSIKLITVLILSYFTVTFCMRGRDEFNIIIPYVKFDRQDQNDTLYILDTSVIIDGRIMDICQTKFLEGRFVIPKFVLKELQQVADSSDDLKRARGRRGLDILANIKKTPSIAIKIYEDDFPELHGVDEKLIKLGKVLGAKVLTNDYNLNKVAELQGVTILNINELAGALRPVFLPGEAMTIKIVREGKESHQGVGFLDDGTMVVVDHAKKHVGSAITVQVTSVLQTSAGRMIFARSSETPSA